MAHRILQLQQQYLETQDKEVLGQFYVEVLKYCKHIVKHSRFGKKTEDAFDLAEDITVRLMTTQEPVIKSTPAGYLNAALRFMDKPEKEVTMFDWLATKLSGFDTDDSLYQSYVDELLAYIYVPERIYEAVERCLRNKESLDGVKETIPQEDLKIFKLVMEQVKKYSEEKKGGK